MGSRAALLVGEQLVDVVAARAHYVRKTAGLGWEDSFDVAEREVSADLTVMLRTWDATKEVLNETLAFWTEQGVDELQGAVWDAASAAYAAPVPRPKKIFGARSNYKDHHQEMIEKFGRPPQPMNNPQGFFKPPSSLIGTGEKIVLPPITDDVHHEIELAVVFGRPCRRVGKEEVWDYIAGYTIANDVSSRDLARADNGWVDRGKGVDTYCPMGPYFVTADEVSDPQNLDMELRVNGEVRQSGNTGSMIFDIPTMVSFLSESFTFEPGDILMTGTCKGVGPIHPGELVEATIAGLGRLVNHVVRG